MLSGHLFGGIAGDSYLPFLTVGKPSDQWSLHTPATFNFRWSNLLGIASTQRCLSIGFDGNEIYKQQNFISTRTISRLTVINTTHPRHFENETCKLRYIHLIKRMRVNITLLCLWVTWLQQHRRHTTETVERRGCTHKKQLTRCHGEADNRTSLT